MPNINQSLVPDERAAEFLDDYSLEIRRRAFLGDATDFAASPHAHNAIARANKVLGDGIVTIRRLVKDETKVLVTKHEAAETVANRVEADLTDAMNTLNKLSETEFNNGVELVGDTFHLNPNNAFIDSKLHDWIREQSAKPDGIATIRDAITNDKDIANVLWSSKPFLLGLNAELLGNLKMTAVNKWAPNADKHFENAKKLQATAARYPQVIRTMNASFYSKALADRARSTRVNV